MNALKLAGFDAHGVAGLMAVVGARVFEVAIEVSTGGLEPMSDAGTVAAHFIPAFGVGSLLYLNQRCGPSRPDFGIGILVVLSISIFYGTLYGSGGSLESARKDAWLCEGFTNRQFYEQFSEIYGQAQYIDGEAIVSVSASFFVCSEVKRSQRLVSKQYQALHEMAVMLLIVTVDFSLKLSGTKKAVGVDSISHDHELELAGKVNMFVAILVGAPGYSQLHLNKLNFQIVKNTASRLPGQFCALINFALFLFGSNLVQFLPKFLLAGKRYIIYPIALSQPFRSPTRLTPL